MTVYRVEVEEIRRAVVYVEADEPFEAEEAAKELYQDFIHDDEIEADANTLPKDFVPPPDAEVWVGGPEGQFVDLKDHLEGER